MNSESGVSSRSPADEPHVTVRLLSQARYLSGTRDLVSGVSKRLGFADGACAHIALAVDEALCNIIRHGYGRREDGRIWVHMWPAHGPAGARVDGVRIEIEDECPQTDPSRFRGRELDDVRPGGLGMHIIRKVMDEVRFERREDAGGVGMRVVLFKRLSPEGDGGVGLSPGSKEEGDGRQH